MARARVGRAKWDSRCDGEMAFVTSGHGMRRSAVRVRPPPLIWQEIGDSQVIDAFGSPPRARGAPDEPRRPGVPLAQLGPWASEGADRVATHGDDAKLRPGTHLHAVVRFATPAKAAVAM
jgi:hypothetical protein